MDWECSRSEVPVRDNHGENLCPRQGRCQREDRNQGWRVRNGQSPNRLSISEVRSPLNMTSNNNPEAWL